MFFKVKYLDDLRGERFNVRILENNIINPALDPLYDINRNLLINNTVGSVSVLGEELRRVCYVNSHKFHTMRVLAWVLLAFYVFTFLVLLIFSLCCYHKYRYGMLSGYWKFFLHMWMKL